MTSLAVSQASFAEHHRRRFLLDFRQTIHPNALHRAPGARPGYSPGCGRTTKADCRSRQLVARLCHGSASNQACSCSVTFTSRSGLKSAALRLHATGMAVGLASKTEKSPISRDAQSGEEFDCISKRRHSSVASDGAATKVWST